MPEQGADGDLPALVVEERRARRRRGRRRRSRISGGARAEAALEPAGERADDEHHDRAGSRNRPAYGDGRAEAVPGRPGSCTSCGISRKEPNIAKPITKAARLVDHTPRMRIIRMSTSGCGDAALDAHPRASSTTRGGEQPEHAGRAPAPGVALRHAEQQRAEPERQQRGADPVDLRRRRAPATRARRARWRDGGDDDHDQREPEDPVVDEVVDDHAGQHEAERRRRCRRWPRSGRSRRPPARAGTRRG